MTFTSPLALLGLLTLPIIVALHALRARSQRQVVSSLSLWNFLDAQISGARARRIPFTWLLLVDLLIAALLTLALAQPELALTRTIPNARHLIVILDISTSMTATDEAPTRFARAQADAADLLNTLTPLDTVTLLTFAASAQTIADTRTSNLQPMESGTLISNLQSLTPGQTGSNLPAALALANAAKDPNLPLEIHLFTDAAYKSPITNHQSPITNYPPPLRHVLQQPSHPHPHPFPPLRAKTPTVRPIRQLRRRTCHPPRYSPRGWQPHHIR
ncbi:MAG: hypothetical protein Fur0022_40500 [Anaerolineales bacterium]